MSLGEMGAKPLLPPVNLKIMKKYEFKQIEIEFEKEKTLDVLNKEGLEGWHPVKFSESYEKSGRMLPCSNETWVIAVTLEREV